MVTDITIRFGYIPLMRKFLTYNLSIALMGVLTAPQAKQVFAATCFTIMFGLFKNDPLEKLRKERAKLLEEAMRIQRSGDLKLYALKMETIDRLEKEMEKLLGAKDE